MAHLVPFIKTQFFDDDGVPLAGGKIYTYQAGTSTPLSTWNQVTESNPNLNTNPIILDANGEADIWIGSSSYKFVIKDANDNTLRTVDNVAWFNALGVTTGMLVNGILSADATGRAKMAAGFFGAGIAASLAHFADGFWEATATARAKMADAFITTAKLADGILSADSTGRAKMADGFVTSAKLATDSRIPAGSIMNYGGTSTPSGWLLCDGSAVSRSTYADLFTAIGCSHGVGDGSSTFNLPDLRGKFLRMVDGAAGNDPDKTTRTQAVASTHTVGGGSTTNGSANITVTSTANLAPGMTVSGTNIPASSVVRSITSSTVFVLGNLGNTADVNATGTSSGITFTFSKSPTGNYLGSIQADALESHSHSVVTRIHSGDPSETGNNFAGAGSGSAAGTASVDASGGNETRPLNTYVNCIIKT